MAGYRDTGQGVAVSECKDDGTWSSVSISCVQSEDRQKSILSLVVIPILVLILLITITTLLVRRRRAAAAQAKKLARLASNNSDTQKVVMTVITDLNSVLQERILSILNSSSSGGQSNAESGHVKVMKKYSVKNTRYHKTSPVLDT